MRAMHWRAALSGALTILFCTTLAWAAPERLDDVVPDAFPDRSGAMSFGYSHHGIKLEGPLNDESIAADYFKLRYSFNPKTALAFRYGSYDLAGGTGLLTPLFDNMDRAESFELDLRLNLLTVPAVPPDPETGEGFAAGSSFGIGFSGSQYSMDMGDLARDDSLLKAYLVYTTDLSPEMRAHTIFATGRLAGDDQSGSVNTVGAGLDYILIGGDRPLVLMANGVLDVYNFREPDFNTSRISRFDIGLRYRVAEDWYASLGYTTHNDSENDASGSGVFASFQFVDEPSPPSEEVEVPEEIIEEPAPVEEPAPSEGAQATVAPVIDEGAPTVETPAGGAIFEQPPLMATIPEFVEEPNVAEDSIFVMPEPDGPDAPSAGNDAELAPGPGDDGGDGLVIPPNPVQPPQHTPEGAVMVRAGGEASPPAPHHTRPEDVMLRPPTDPNLGSKVGTLVVAALDETDNENTTPAETYEGG